MIELSNNEFDIVIPLVKTLDYMTVYAFSVIENIQSGKIFVNLKTNPTCCFIANSGGKYIVIGDHTDTKFISDLVAFLSNKQNHFIYYDLYTSSEKWIEPIKNMLVGQTVTLSHTSFTFNESKFLRLKNRKDKLPTNYVTKSMDRHLFEKYQNEIDPMYKFLWNSADNFLERGFGFCILIDEQFASVCNSFNVGGGYAEIDIVTSEQYRRNGLATLTCSAFIELSLEKNIIPNWSCDSGNLASIQLATKLGFEKNNDCKMLWWHENKDVVTNYLRRFSYE